MTTTITETTTLTPEQARAEWVEALRSGKYQQTKEQLRLTEEVVELRKDTLRAQGFREEMLAEIGRNLTPGLCCLGVACEVAKEYGVIDDYTYSDGGPVREVWEFFGLRDESGTLDGEWLNDQVRQEKIQVSTGSLIALNDGEDYTFDQIADVIEAGIASAPVGNLEEGE